VAGGNCEGDEIKINKKQNNFLVISAIMLNFAPDLNSNAQVALSEQGGSGLERRRW
jgi:hypothetical protein